MDVEADNKRLRHEMRRVIAEREIAVTALRVIVHLPRTASYEAERALDRIMALPRGGDL